MSAHIVRGSVWLKREKLIGMMFLDQMRSWIVDRDTIHSGLQEKAWMLVYGSNKTVSKDI